MTEPFLETGEDRLLVRGLDIDDPVGRQAGLGQGGGEQILAGDAPEDLAAGPGRETGGEQGRGRAVDGPVPAAGDLMQGAQRQPAAGKAAIEDLQAERQDPLGRTSAGLDLFDRGAQSVEGARGRDGHGLQNRRAIFMFPIRSS